MGFKRTQFKTIKMMKLKHIHENQSDPMHHEEVHATVKHIKYENIHD